MHIVQYPSKHIGHVSSVNSLNKSVSIVTYNIIYHCRKKSILQQYNYYIKL